MSDTHLPSPPDDQELYWYFGPQKRWVLVSTSIAFTFTAVTLLLFSLRTPALWLFLGVLALNLGATGCSLINSLRTRRLTRTSHEILLGAWNTAAEPSVDLYLPTCGEPLDILANAYQYASALDWSGPLTIWVLDDADRPEVAELAAQHGFEYVVRPDRGHLKKAGNLNHALTLSSAEVIAILDADFCPRPDFLRHLVPYLASPEVGIVQSPQCFDTTASMGWIERAAGAAQEWFFRWIQPSRDASDAAICCGSNAIYRRAAIDAAGGFAKLDHSEDMYTGLAVYEHGYRVLYVPVLLAKGTSPESLASFVNQQYRWAMGNLNLLTRRDLARLHAPWRMRLCYYEGVLGYLATAANVLAAPLPPIIMLIWYPQEIRPWHVLPLLAPLWVWHVLLPRVSRTRWRLEVIRSNVLMSVAAWFAAVHVLRNKSATWVPTGSGGGKSALARKVTVISLVWLTVTLAAGLVAFALACGRLGWQPLWGLAIYFGVQMQVEVPLIRDLWSSLRGASPGRTPRPRGTKAGMRPRRWPEALAMTSGLALVALLASGLLNPML